MKSVIFGIGLIAIFGALLYYGQHHTGAKLNLSKDFPVADETEIQKTGLSEESAGEVSNESETTADDKASKKEKKKLELATFGSGCFWCTEAFFQELRGVKKVVSGYSGGHVKNPTYDAVCAGTTGHAEVVQITYDPEEIKFSDLLKAFWQTHDPTTLNRQGADVGTQYRSAIFYHSDDQKEVAELYKKKLDDKKVFADPIVTEITKFTNFFAAEKYHQDFFKLNPNQPYCRAVIIPKMKKFKEVFADQLNK